MEYHQELLHCQLEERECLNRINESSTWWIGVNDWRVERKLIMKEIMESQKNQALAINELCRIVHEANRKWWIDLETGNPANRNVGELLMLCVSELAEAADGQENDLFLSLLLMKIVKRLAFALEGHRKSKQDDKLPHRPMLEVELVDAVIRIFDIGEGLGLDLGGAFIEKMSYNAHRTDHKVENRLKRGGKKY